MKLTAFSSRMLSLILTTCLFMSLNGKMTSIGRVTPLILPDLGNQRVQLPLLKRFLRFYRSSPSSCPLVRRIIKSKSREYFHANIGVCSSTLREEFKKFIEPFVDDVSKYGTHSMRSGAASNPACRRIPGDLLDMHVGWRCPSSKNRYIKHTIKDRLSVSKSLLL